MKTDIQKERDKFRPIGGEQAINTHSNYQTVNSQFHTPVRDKDLLRKVPIA